MRERIGAGEIILLILISSSLILVVYSITELFRAAMKLPLGGGVRLPQLPGVEAPPPPRVEADAPLPRLLVPGPGGPVADNARAAIIYLLKLLTNPLALVFLIGLGVVAGALARG